MRVVAPPDVAASLARIWKGRTRVLSHLRSLPQGFAHLDAFAQNIFFRPHPGVGDETVLIDWSFAGLAAPGEELASLCFSSLGFAPSLLAIIDDVEAAIVPAYVQGLRDAGWICDEADIWHAYRSTVTLRYVAAAPSVAQWAMESGDAQEAIAGALGVADGDLFEHLAACARWIAARAGNGQASSGHLACGVPVPRSR
jgi:aminoglycoside phosphotransferase (APT) family kinase protein